MYAHLNNLSDAELSVAVANMADIQEMIAEGKEMSNENLLEKLQQYNRALYNADLTDRVLFARVEAVVTSYQNEVLARMSK